MADLTPSPLSVQASDPLVYRPLSLLAVSGFGLAVLTAVSLVAVMVYALISGTPLLVPLILAPIVVAFGLSLAGRWSIQRSEGTQAGMFLATVGMGVSLLSGVGYGAYIFAKELAVRTEAQGETDRWLTLFREGKANEAFVRTLEPEPRLSVNANDARGLLARFAFMEGNKGRLPVFQDDKLVRALSQAGPEMSFESQGVKNWEYLGGATKAYKVIQVYRVTTPEMKFDAVVSVTGSESQSQAYKGRQWQVLMNESGVIEDPQTGSTTVELTPFGQAIDLLRRDCGRFQAQWRQKLSQGQVADAYLDTLDPARRKQLLAEYEAVLTGWWTLLANTDVAHRAFVPGYADFLKGGLFNDSEFLAVNDEAREEIVRDITQLFRRAAKDPASVPQMTDARSAGFSRWTLDGSTLRFDQPFEYSVFPNYRCEGTVALVTDDPEVVQLLQQLKQQGKSGKFAGLPDRPLGWRIQSIDLKLGPNLQARGPMDGP